MDNAQKAIMVGVGLFITIIIIAAVMLITGIGTNLVNKGTEKAGNVSAQLDQTELEMYDNTTMSGAQVLSAVKKYYTDNTIIVYLMIGGTKTPVTPKKISGAGVTTQKDDTNTTILYFKNYTGTVVEDNSGRPSLGDFSQVGNDNYIGNSTQWQAYLLKFNDSNIGIVFKKK